MLSGSILVVCAGNICRSPFAACYLEKRLKEAKRNLGIQSCGLIACPGNRVTAEALEAAALFDVDLSGHRARPLDDIMVERSGLILVMEQGQRRMIKRMYSQAAGRIFLLSHMSPGPLADSDVDDPYGMGVDAYIRIYGQIVLHVDAWLAHLITDREVSFDRTGIKTDP